MYYQAIISKNKGDMEYMIKKLIEKYEKWRLTVNNQILGVLISLVLFL